MKDRGTWRPVFDDRSRYLDRYGRLLGVTIVTVVLLALVDLSKLKEDPIARVGSVIAFVLVGTMLLLALRASGLSRRWQRIADVVVWVTVGLILFVTITSAFVVLPAQASPAPLGIVALALVAPAVVVRRLIEHREVTRATLLGAICGYLLIPVAFFLAFLACNESVAGPFFASPEPSPSYMYFSLTTLTTVGYGDLTAVTNVGRLLASAEAVLGQVYLVTFVAMIVGLYAAARGARRADEKSQSGP
jgi:drug/metabolite transporter (DMT)-like permease